MQKMRRKSRGQQSKVVKRIENSKPEKLAILQRAPDILYGKCVGSRGGSSRTARYVKRGENSKPEKISNPKMGSRYLVREMRRKSRGQQSNSSFCETWRKFET